MSDEIIDDYKLVKHMATGQASQVWEVVEIGSSRHLAMKLLLPERLGDGDNYNFLVHEAEVGLKLAHPNVIRIFKLNRRKDNPYFVMEFFPAGSVRLRLQRKDTQFFEEKTMDIMKQTATGMAFMNAQGYVHRDLKPDNILVNASGEVKIIDFALAYQPPSFISRLFSGKGKPQGTRSYMSPEQIRCELLDGRADIYSFGCMAFELTTGRTPFRGTSANEILTKHLKEKPISPKQVNPRVSKPFGDFVLRMISKKKEDRPKDFHEVLMGLKNMKIMDSEAPEKKS
jgi:serine/threonine-protein kinase